MSNQIVITGNLAGDPELRFTPSGAAVANFTVCDTPRKFDRDRNEWVDAGDTLFMRCAIWREDAELVAETLKRGQKVTVTGKLTQRSYEKDGEKRIVIECTAESVAPHAGRQQGQRQQQSGGDPWGKPAGGSWGGANDEPPF